MEETFEQANGSRLFPAVNTFSLFKVGFASLSAFPSDYIANKSSKLMTFEKTLLHLLGIIPKVVIKVFLMEYLFGTSFSIKEALKRIFVSKLLSTRNFDP